jgi:hypothetical protein
MVQLSNRDLMERFVGRHGPADTTLQEDHGTWWLDVSEPAVLANFYAFCKGTRSDRLRSVFLRGQNQPYPTLIPSLFRLSSSSSVPQRWAAYREFLQQLPECVRGTRFTKDNFGAVLQHYGFRTPWLDVVDDLHAAIWFALHKCECVGSKCVYRPTTDTHGWVVVIEAPPSGHVQVQDLREVQSSRNTRCNAQQGYSLAMQCDDVNKPHAEQNFMDSVVGIVQIPNNARWRVRGFRSSQSFFFPPACLDDTYRQLLESKVAALAEQVEKTHGLEVSTLGRVIQYVRRLPAGTRV